MNRRIRLVLKVSVMAFATIIGIMTTLVTFNNHTSANNNEQIQNALYTALWTCYGGSSAPSGSYMQAQIEDASNLNFWPSNFVSNDDKVFTMPGYYTPSSNGENKLAINCKQVFEGANLSNTSVGRFQGLADGNSGPYDPMNFGYFPDNSATVYERKCRYYTYKLNGTTEKTTNGICVPVDANGNINITNPISDITFMDNKRLDVGAGFLNIVFNEWNYTIDVGYCTPSGSNEYGWSCNDGVNSRVIACYLYGEGNNQCGPTWQDFINKLGYAFHHFDNLSCAGNPDGTGIAPEGCHDYREGYDDQGLMPAGSIVGHDRADGSATATGYKLASNSALKTLEHFKGSSANFRDVYFTGERNLQMYVSYYNAMKEKYPTLAVLGSCSDNKNDYNYAIVNSSKQWCQVPDAAVAEVQEKFGIVDTVYRLKIGSFSDVMRELKNVNVDAIDIGNVDLNTGGTEDPGVSAGELSDSACYDAAAPLGWIVCPVIKAVGNATGFMYKNWISPMLNIKASELFTTSDSNSGVYGGWSIFRTFSNILFAIAFVIVILAQITGIGISNYNIKKILPRLIMVVVLVNISFILCQLAVDVSNILGSTLESTLENLSVGSSNDQQTFMSALGTFINGLGLGAGALTGVGIALGSGVFAAEAQFFLVPLLLAILGCAISVLFFFIILGARQAAVVILTVLAPVAIVCYALPNTKTLFDKWKRMFTAMLMVYPICGLLMGGGNFVSALMLAAAPGGWDPLYGLIAMLISVVPFFMVPSILRSSMAAVGNLGARIQGLGAGLRSGLTRTIKGSNAYQESQNEKLRNLNIRRAQTRVGRYSKDPNAGGGLIGRARRSLGLNDNLSEYKTARLGQAQSTIDKLTGDTGAAIEASWKNDGSADNIGTQEEYENGTNTDSIYGRYIQATRDLMKDPNNHGALERQKAAASILASSAPGRAQLHNANAALANYVGTLDAGSADYSKASRILNRTANNLMRTNGNDIAKSGLLEEQLKEFMKPDAQYIGPDKNGQTLNERVLTSSIDGLNTRAVAEMNKRDIDKYLDAARAGKLNASQIRALSDLAGKAMTDQHYKGSIKKDAMPGIQQLANLQYNQSSAVSGRDMSETIANTDAVQSSLANASSEELSRIRSSLGSMSDTERAQTLANLGETLTRAVSGEEGFTMSADNANQISKILQENHVDAAALGSQYGITDYQDKLDQLTGIKIQHPPRQTLTDRHANWRRATAADVQQVMGTARRGPHARVPFAVDDWVEVDGSGRITKLDARRAKEAEMLETADLEADRVQQDEDFRAQQRRQNP